jgi:two-component system, OmpR family, alkaline phosphatase synthesis response regulator PhoP
MQERKKQGKNIMSKPDIMIVEDEEDIQELIEYNLIKNGFNPVVYSSGEDALASISRFSPDLILLDFMLPGIDGLEVCKKLKNNEETNKIPIIMLTARGEEETIIKCFEHGVDDYVTKPFSPKILISRIKAVLRRQSDEKHDNNSTIIIHDLTINPIKHEALLDNIPLKLTNAEFKALYLLASKPGWVLTRYQIIDEIKGEDYEVTDRSVDVLMVGLRKKLDKYGHYVETVRGVGYRFKE